METLLLAVTVISLIVALFMSVSAWRVTRDEKRRSAARIAALSLAATEGAREQVAPARLSGAANPRPATVPAPQEMFLNEPASAREISHATGFLGGPMPPLATGSTGRQHSLAIAAAVLFVGLASGLFWMMSGPRGTTAAAVGPNMPLELVSLRHDRQNSKLAVSGLVRNPVTGRPVEHVSAVVFLFDQQGTFMTSATAPVDFIKLGVGDESPFVVALDAPTTVARYRVSFRTDEGVVPHIDRRGATPIANGAEQPVSVRLK